MIKPQGFFKTFLKTQITGLTGHIKESGYPFDIVEWGQKDFNSTNGNSKWWVYEQTAYWLDGYIRASILLNNQDIINNASRIIYNVLNSPDQDNYLGPQIMKHGTRNRWAHVVFFRACKALYEYNNDQFIIDSITNHYITDGFIYNTYRDVMNVEIMLWLYGINHNENLLKLAIKSYKIYNQEKIEELYDELLLSKKKVCVHGVTYNEYSKLGILLYKYTNDPYYKEVSVKAFKKLDRYYMLPAGCPDSEEYTYSSYYYGSYETCDITDYTWSLSYMLKELKKAEYGDKIEKCIFNAGMGSILEDFKGLQYLSSANQFISASNSNHNYFKRGNKWMTYRPNPGTECCPGNVNRFMPNYVLNMFYNEGDHIYCNLYGSSIYETRINNKKVTINEKTNFPFGETFTFKIKTEIPFTFYLRKPGYGTDYKILVNGKEIRLVGKEYFIIKIKKDTVITFSYNTEIKEVSLPKSCYFTKGVLVYSYGMKGKRIVDEKEERSSEEFKAYNIYADKEIGFAIKKTQPKFYKFNAKAFDLDKKLPFIEVEAYKIINSGLLKKNKIKSLTSEWPGTRKDKILEGNFLFTPDLLKRKLRLKTEGQVIRLYPYGACKIRETVFSKVD